MNHTQRKNICVFCGSGNGNSPSYTEAAEILGKAIAKANLGLVYGGGNIGLMGVVARSALKHDGHVTGIIPEFLRKREISLHEAQDLIITSDMHERKRLMFEKSDAFVALPGGIGTLEELVEQLTWAQLGHHEKPIILANVSGFWNPFLDLIEHMCKEKFIRPGLEVTFHTVDDVWSIVPKAMSLIGLAHKLNPEQQELISKM